MSAGSDREAARAARRTRAVLLGALLLLLLHTVLVVRLAYVGGATVDEPAYLNAGRAVLRGDWSHEPTRLHGPLAFYPNQLLIRDFPRGGYWEAPDRRALLFRSRLGMLPFAWLLGAVVFAWSRRLFGDAGGLLSLGLYALDPLMLGYASLVAVDVAHCALVVAALHAAWRFACAPGRGARTPLRAALVGLVLGLAFATKYLSLLVGPVVGLAVLLGVVLDPGRAALGGLRRCGEAAGALLLCGLAALLALHASYGFRVPHASGDPAAYRSELVKGLVDAPGLGLLLQTLPEPYLGGVDFQAAIGEQPHLRPYLNGRFAESHPTYYVWAFLLKTPTWLVALTLFVLALRLPAWLAGRGAREECVAAWLVAGTVAATWPYLSTSTGLQIGIRYVLPTYPLFFVLLGGLAAWPALRRAPRPLLAAGVLLLLAWNARDLAGPWPDLVAYYNELAGGQANAYHHFLDSNSDWGERREHGLDELRATEERPFEVLSPASGPRLGRIVVGIRDLVRPDPEDERVFRHWLQAVEPPVRHVGATWYLFDASLEAWDADLARREDPRRRLELAIALLGAGRRAEARERAAPLPPEARARFDALDAATELAPDAPDQDVLRAARAWSDDAARHDKAEELLRSRPELARTQAHLLALTQVKRGHVDDAIATLLSSPFGESARGLGLLAQLYWSQDRCDEAVAALERAQRLAPTDERLAERLREEREATAKRHAFLSALTD